MSQIKLVSTLIASLIVFKDLIAEKKKSHSQELRVKSSTYTIQGDTIFQDIGIFRINYL